MEPIISVKHTMSPRDFARVATERFVRRSWPYYVLAVAAGVGLLVFTRDTITMVFGLILTLYPFITPMRYAGMAAARARPFTNVETTYEVTEDEIIVRTANGGVTRGSLKNVKRVDEVRNCLVLQFAKATFVIVPLFAFPESKRLEVATRIRQGMMAS